MTTRGRRLRYSGVALALAMSGVLVGCSESPPERAGTVNESSATDADTDGSSTSAAEAEEVELDAVGRELTTDEAKAALPQVSSLPTGWSVDADNSLNDDSDEDSKATIEPAKCQALQDGMAEYREKQGEPSAQASRTYTGGGLGPFMGVEISSFADEIPDDMLKKSLDALSACPEFTSTEDGQSTTFKTSSLSFPNLGDESVAFRMNAESDGMPIEMTFVYIRAGHNGIAVSHAAVGAASGAAEDVEKLARATVANLERD